MTSWIVFSWVAENWADPILFAGTWKQYSTKAIDQLARMAIHNGELLYFRWPYHAKVMNTFDTVRRSMVFIDLYYTRPGPEGSTALLYELNLKGQNSMRRIAAETHSPQGMQGLISCFRSGDHFPVVLVMQEVLKTRIGPDAPDPHFG